MIRLMVKASAKTLGDLEKELVSTRIFAAGDSSTPALSEVQQARSSSFIKPQP